MNIKKQWMKTLNSIHCLLTRLPSSVPHCSVGEIWQRALLPRLRPRFHCPFNHWLAQSARCQQPISPNFLWRREFPIVGVSRGLLRILWPLRRRIWKRFAHSQVGDFAFTIGACLLLHAFST